MIKLTNSCRETGRIYAEGLIEACSAARPAADPVKVLTDTDEYPHVVKKIEQAEFIVGWFHGVAEAAGVLVEVIWEALAPAPAPVKAPKPAPRARKAGAPKAKPAPKARKSRAKAQADMRAALEELATATPAPARKPRKRRVPTGVQLELGGDR